MDYRSSIDRVIAQLLIEQSDAVLNAIEGEVSIVEVTSFVGGKGDDLDRLRARIRKIKESKK